METFIKHRAMFYHKVIEPFLQPFQGMTEHIFAKFAIFLTMASGTFLGLFDTPEGYWYTLTILILLDAAGKSIRIIFVTQSRWSFDLFIRKTLYKITSYMVIVTAATVFSNQWETDSNFVQYAVYWGLCALEGYSVGRHFKIVAFLVVVFRQLSGGKIDFDKIQEEMEAYTIQNEKDLENG